MVSSVKRIELVLLILTVSSVVLSQSTEPKLVISPPQPELTTPAGKPYGLMCSGMPEEDGAFIDMKWINPRGEVIPRGTPGTKEFGQSSLKLSFVNPDVEDSGSYKCTALYSNTVTLEVEVSVSFYEDIRFEDCPDKQNLVVGREGHIKCRPVANPKPSISWEKSKQKVTSERFSISPSGITISSVQPDDGGLYTVEAFVARTGNNKYRDITVNVLTPPRIIELPEEFIVIQGEEYTITCRADGSRPLTYSWLDPNLRNLSSVEGYRVEDGLLTIYRVDRNAGGDYKCKVANPAGEDEATVRLDVQVRPNIVQLENITREEGNAALFECKAEGVPRPTLSLRRDRSYQPLEHGEEGRIEVEEVDDGDLRVLRVTISNIKRSDDGLYFCKASNAAGDVERVGHLEVQFPPDMSATPSTAVKAWSANPANLSCVAEANPNASISWKFQGDAIAQDDKRFKISGVMSYSNLVVLTDKRDSYEIYGTYTCEARNPLGENTININLEEATVPSQVSQVVFHKVTPTTITFRFMGPGNTGGLPIISFLLRYKEIDQPDSSLVTIDWAKDSPFILSDLKPRVKYFFSVSARNVVGEGPKITTEYLMPEESAPEAPTIVTEQETISDYPDRFVVVWNVPSDNGMPIQYFSIRYYKVERGLKDWDLVGKATEKILRNWDARPSYELTGLSADTYYKIEIRATNSIGNSPDGWVVIRTRAGETNDGHTSMMDGEKISTPVIVAIVLVALFLTLVVLDIISFFLFHCGVLYLMRYRTCGRSAEKMPGSLEDGRACVKEVSTAKNGKIKSELKSPSSPDQLPPPDKLSNYEEKPKTEVDNPAFENRDVRPADLIIDENFKNKSPKGSKTSIGKSSPV